MIKIEQEFELPLTRNGKEILDVDGMHLADCQHENVAQFLALAGNLHFELLDCLKTLQNRARGKKLNCPNQKLFDRIQAVINKAEGK